MGVIQRKVHCLRSICSFLYFESHRNESYNTCECVAKAHIGYLTILFGKVFSPPLSSLAPSLALLAWEKWIKKLIPFPLLQSGTTHILETGESGWHKQKDTALVCVVNWMEILWCFCLAKGNHRCKGVPFWMFASTDVSTENMSACSKPNRSPRGATSSVQL